MDTKEKYKTVKAAVSMDQIIDFYFGGEVGERFTSREDQLRGSCVLCETKKRSTLSINTTKNCFQRFCCKQKGNILDFVAAKEGVNVSEAVELIADWFGIETETPGNSREESDQAFPISDDEGNKPLSFELKNIDHTHEKVKSLGISDKTAAYFGAGYYGGRGMFKDHVVFPIHNETGELIGYAGVGGEDGAVTYPEKFRCDLALYNAHRVAHSLKTIPDPIFIANSPLDVARLYEAGVRHAVGSMSTLLGQEQLNIMAAIANVSSDNLQSQVVNEAPAARYGMSDDEILDRGASILAKRMQRGDVFSSPLQVSEFFKRKLSHLDHEVFMCMFLDNKNQMIAADHLFSGTVDQVSVYPREIAKKSLEYGASAVIAAHNHPSGVPEPSVSDKKITKQTKDVLSLLDVRVLDHIIVGGNETVSLAERGLI